MVTQIVHHSAEIGEIVQFPPSGTIKGLLYSIYSILNHSCMYFPVKKKIKKLQCSIENPIVLDCKLQCIFLEKSSINTV